MGRKIRFKLLTGSLLRPIYQFTQKLEFCVNPLADPHGSRLATHIHQTALNIKPKYKPQNFASSLQYDFTTTSSTMIIHFVNGWKQGFHLKKATLKDLQEKHKFYNQFIKFERDLQGLDDEYEDEEEMR